MIERRKMTEREQRPAAREFAEYWKDKGYEKGESQPFWLSLLRQVFGVTTPERAIIFEDQVMLGHTSFIDARIPETRVLIEQKGKHKSLTEKIKQSDGTMLTPFQQAKRYIPSLPLSEHPRWVVVSNFEEIHVYDMERPSGEPEIIKLEEFETDYYRLEFLVRSNAEVAAKEQEISIQAGELVGRLYDALLKNYKDPTSEASLHSLNALCVRLVFCLYAEDANIFVHKKMFHNYLEPWRDKPSAVRRALLDLFEVLDQKDEERDPYLDEDLAVFPYVNGGLFSNASKLEVPQFTPEIVELLLREASDGFDWSQISPTIFGAVFESTLNPETRRKGGMHYTSITNIHKVIDPLFLNDLKAEWEAILQKKQLKEQRRMAVTFQKKLSGLTFLDPACGSGNFLTETYLSLRRLENDVLRHLSGGSEYFNFGDNGPVQVQINQFYGIEINDFAVSVAQTALWIAESQMLRETEDILKRDLDFLPLKSYTNIREGNALRIDWGNVVPLETLSFIMGNPPFAGARFMSKEQKLDLFSVFGNKWKNAGDIDYVGSWFKKASDVMAEYPTIRSAFVATNSISQGTSVSNLWSPILSSGTHIDFAWRSFIWDSEASEKAHVHCVIVGFSNSTVQNKRTIFDGETVKDVRNINGYLIDGTNIAVASLSSPLCNVPEIGMGNQPIDDGQYLFTEDEKEEFLKEEPEAKPFFKKYFGAREFINQKPRYCLWLGDCSPAQLRRLPKCRERIERVKEFRLSSDRESTVKMADYPTRFQTENMPSSDYIVIPEVSSERRSYIPLGFMNPDVLCSNKLRLMPGASLYHFGILNSSVHMAWMRAVAGRLKSDYSYSIDIVYNAFVWPDVDDATRIKIEKTAQAILDVRAKYPDSTLADLYDDTTMPADLKKAHQANDKAVLKACGLKSTATESEIVGILLSRYKDRVDQIEKEKATDKAIKKILGKNADNVPDWLQDLRAQCLDGKITAEELLVQGKARKKELTAAERKSRRESGKQKM